MRKRALESLVNNPVIKLETGLYRWGDIIYEVKPYDKILTKKYGHGAGQYIKWTYKGILFGIREMSLKMIEKYYPQSLDKTLDL